MKLHLGCGHNLKQDWLNLDLLDKDAFNYKKIDLINNFDFNNLSVDYIYTEHFLEHLDEVDGFKLLNNCFNCLKNGGVLRISIPCLDYILQNFNDFENIKQKNDWYSKFVSKEQYLNFVMFGESSTKEKIKFLNNIDSTNDGHKFFYSKTDLFNKLKQIGFSDVYEVEKYKSIYQDLRDLETRQQFSDITIEAIK